MPQVPVDLCLNKPNLHEGFHLIVPMLKVKLVILLKLPSSYLLDAFSPTKCYTKYVQEGSDKSAVGRSENPGEGA